MKMIKILATFFGLVLTIVLGYLSYQKKEEQLRQAKYRLNSTLSNLATQTEEQFNKLQNEIKNCKGQRCLSIVNVSPVISKLELIGKAYHEEGCQAHVDSYAFLKAVIEYQYDLHTTKGLEGLKAFKIDQHQVQESFNTLKKDCVI